MSYSSSSDEEVPYTTPYSGILMPRTDNIDLNTVAPMLGVMNSNAADYLEYNLKGRSYSERISYNTGVTYLAGIGLGGAFGFFQGLRTSPSPRFKIRVNSVLNGCGKYGSKTGNMLGVLSLFYTSFEELCDTVEVEKYIPYPEVPPILAAAATGAIYRSTGSRGTMLLASLLGAGLMGVYTFAGKYMSDRMGTRSRAGLFL